MMHGFIALFSVHELLTVQIAKPSFAGRCRRIMVTRAFRGTRSCCRGRRMDRQLRLPAAAASSRPSPEEIATSKAWLKRAERGDDQQTIRWLWDVVNSGCSFCWFKHPAQKSGTWNLLYSWCLLRWLWLAVATVVGGFVVVYQVRDHSHPDPYVPTTAAVGRYSLGRRPSLLGWRPLLLGSIRYFPHYIYIQIWLIIAYTYYMLYMHPIGLCRAFRKAPQHG